MGASRRAESPGPTLGTEIVIRSDTTIVIAHSGNGRRLRLQEDVLVIIR